MLAQQASRVRRGVCSVSRCRCWCLGRVLWFAFTAAFVFFGNLCGCARMVTFLSYYGLTSKIEECVFWTHSHCPLNSLPFPSRDPAPRNHAFMEDVTPRLWVHPECLKLDRISPADWKRHTPSSPNVRGRNLAGGLLRKGSFWKIEGQEKEKSLF